MSQRRKSWGKESRLGYRESAGGEPQRTDRGRGSFPGERDGRTRCGAGDDGAARRHATADGRAATKASTRSDLWRSAEICPQTPHVAQNLERRGAARLLAALRVYENLYVLPRRSLRSAVDSFARTFAILLQLGFLIIPDLLLGRNRQMSVGDPQLSNHYKLPVA